MWSEDLNRSSHQSRTADYPIDHVLNGQQRVTSIHAVFKPNNEDRFRVHHSATYTRRLTGYCRAGMIESHCDR